MLSPFYFITTLLSKQGHRQWHETWVQVYELSQKKEKKDSSKPYVITVAQKLPAIFQITCSMFLLALLISLLFLLIVDKDLPL